MKVANKFVCAFKWSSSSLSLKIYSGLLDQTSGVAIIGSISLARGFDFILKSQSSLDFDSSFSRLL